MGACNELSVTHEDFMRLVYAVQSNKMYLQSNKNLPDFSDDDQRVLQELIRLQERLLKEMMDALNLEKQIDN